MGKSGKSGKGKAGSKEGSSRRDLESLVEDADFFVEADKDAEYQFFDRELYSSSKKGKGKAGSKKSGKSGKGKAGSKKGSSRRELESLMQDLEMAHDIDFFDANDKDAEYQFFDRELYSSSKKGKGKAGSKKSGKSGKGKAGSKKGSSRRE